MTRKQKVELRKAVEDAWAKGDCEGASDIIQNLVPDRSRALIRWDKEIGRALQRSAEGDITRVRLNRIFKRLDMKLLKELGA